MCDKNTFSLILLVFSLASKATSHFIQNTAVNNSVQPYSTEEKPSREVEYEKIFQDLIKSNKKLQPQIEGELHMELLLSRTRFELFMLKQKKQSDQINNTLKELLKLRDQVPVWLENAAKSQRKWLKKYHQCSKELNVKVQPKFDKHFNCVEGCGNLECLPRDCDKVFEETTNKDGIYVLKTEGELKPFGAFCQRNDNKGWTIIQRRQDGSVDFYRNWENYKNGFGNLSGEFWLGLERLHVLTSKAKYMLWVQLETLENKTYTYRYSTFAIAEESEGYKLKIGDFSGGSAEDDALDMDNDWKFSTFDKDHDNIDDMSCAEKRKGAWWYVGCSSNNLNGEYKPLSEDRNDTGLWWWGSGSEESLKYVHLAIRPVLHGSQ